MANFIHFSDSTKIALHAMMHLAAASPRPLSQPDIATAFDFSKAHVAKVMQMLRHAGLVESIRGPAGGFALTRDPAEITLFEVYAAVHRVRESASCILNKPRCRERCCQLGGIVERMEQELRTYMEKTSVLQMSMNLPEFEKKIS